MIYLKENSFSRLWVISNFGTICQMLHKSSPHFLILVHHLNNWEQGTVLGPILFLIYINDITRNIESQCKLFADDMKVYKVLRNVHEDTQILQNDLNSWVALMWWGGHVGVQNNGKMTLKFCIIIESNCQKTFFAVVLYTKMAAMTSGANQEYTRAVEHWMAAKF